MDDVEEKWTTFQYVVVVVMDDESSVNSEDQVNLLNEVQFGYKRCSCH
jgi:hypothetical protein